jgi:hypothetical protein
MNRSSLIRTMLQRHHILTGNRYYHVNHPFYEVDGNVV